MIGQTYISKLHNKDRHKLKGASKWNKHVTQGNQFG